MTTPERMTWVGQDEIAYCSDEHYVKLRSTEDWLKAIASIRSKLPNSFATENDALVTSWNLQVLINQAKIFSFKPVGEDTLISRTFGAEYPHDALSESLTIEVDSYNEIVEAVGELSLAYERALINSSGHWQPERVETVFNLMTIANERIEHSSPTVEELKNVFRDFWHMLEHLAVLEEQRVMNEVVVPAAN